MKVFLIFFIFLLVLTGIENKKPSKTKYSNKDGLNQTSNVDIYLYTRNQRSGIKVNRALPADFDRSLPTYVLLHGLGGSHASFCQKNIREALLNQGTYNILTPSYRNSSILYTLLYKDLSRKIGYYLKNEKVDPSKTFVIAASLGAHIAGLMREQSGFTPKIIYGLDAAGPLFDSRPDSERLNTKSADYVQVFHSNAGRLGAVSPLGHDDIYVNGGNSHPCCKSDVCRHNVVCEIMANSVQTGPIKAQQCDSLNQARSATCRGSAIEVGFGSASRSGRRISLLRVDACGK